MFSYITDIDIKVPYNSVFEKATDIKEIRINWIAKERSACSDCVCGCRSQRRQPIDERTRSRGRCYQSLISQSPSSWAESKGTVLICKSIYGDGHCLGPTEITCWTVLDYRRFRCSGCKLGYKHHRFVTTNRHKHKQVVYIRRTLRAMPTTVRSTCTLDAFVNCGPYTALDQLGVSCSDVRITSLVVEVPSLFFLFACVVDYTLKTIRINHINYLFL